MKSLDLQDGLILAGTASLCAGVGFIYWPFSLILFGLLCFVAVILIQRTKAIKSNDGPAR